jgi:ABC-type antimicrobial peptide transport system permease subunit
MLGLLLAAIGVHGVTSFLVAQRTREIGLRMALGATPRRIIGLVLAHAARWSLTGAFTGLIGSFFAARLLRSLLFKTSDADPVAFGGAVILLLLVALTAAWAPSIRAALIDPAMALRRE